MATTKVTELNRLIDYKNGTTHGKTVLECVKILAKLYDDVDVPSTKLTTAKALQYWAAVVNGACFTTFEVVDAEGEAVESPTITLKKGSTIGSGTKVNPEADGSFKLTEGKYNYNIAKTNYTTITGVIDITEALLLIGTLVVNVELKAN